MTLIEWLIVIFLFTPLVLMVAGFGVAITYMQATEGRE